MPVLKIVVIGICIGLLGVMFERWSPPYIAGLVGIWILWIAWKPQSSAPNDESVEVPETRIEPGSAEQAQRPEVIELYRETAPARSLRWGRVLTVLGLGVVVVWGILILVYAPERDVISSSEELIVPELESSANPSSSMTFTDLRSFVIGKAEGPPPPQILANYWDRGSCLDRTLPRFVDDEIASAPNVTAQTVAWPFAMIYCAREWDDRAIRRVYEHLKRNHLLITAQAPGIGGPTIDDLLAENGDEALRAFAGVGISAAMLHSLRKQQDPTVASELAAVFAKGEPTTAEAVLEAIREIDFEQILTHAKPKYRRFVISEASPRLHIYSTVGWSSTLAQVGTQFWALAKIAAAFKSGELPAGIEMLDADVLISSASPFETVNFSFLSLWLKAQLHRHGNPSALHDLDVTFGSAVDPSCGTHQSGDETTAVYCLAQKRIAVKFDLGSDPRSSLSERGFAALSPSLFHEFVHYFDNDGPFAPVPLMAEGHASSVGEISVQLLLDVEETAQKNPDLAATILSAGALESRSLLEQETRRAILTRTLTARQRELACNIVRRPPTPEEVLTQATHLRSTFRAQSDRIRGYALGWMLFHAGFRADPLRDSFPELESLATEARNGGGKTPSYRENVIALTTTAVDAVKAEVAEKGIDCDRETQADRKAQ